MPKKITLFLLLSFFISVSCTKETKEKQVTAVNEAPFQAILDQKSKSYQTKRSGKEYGFGLYIKGEHLDLYVSAGLPDGNPENIHFRGGSSTKSFISAAIFKLQQSGKLHIDDRLVDLIPGTNEPYLPNTPSYAVPYKDLITIRQLLNHRAGIFDVTNTPILSTVDAPYAGENYVNYLQGVKGQLHTFTFEEMISVVAKHKLSYFVPNTAFHYSNTGYNLLAVIIRRVSGAPLHQFLQEEFHALGMKDTFFPPYSLDNVASAMSEGNIVTTPKDLSTWAFHLYASKKVVNKQHLKEMIANIPTNEQHVIYGSGGAVPAYISTMHYHQPTKKTYLVFSTFYNDDDFKQQADDMDAIISAAIKEVEMKSL
ncbi:serine hydrolase domain-containing protein [Pedobacter immunditicola]|uniref:serine hydrolase domain-containing protein n=1 Tax=Pedobacter immunditicola TaxID=3133440 RepID=UPI0030AD8867